MPVDTVTSPQAPPQADSPSPSPKGRVLGVGGWVCAVWLLFMVVVAIIGPSLAAEPITEGNLVIQGCGDRSGLPIYDPLKCVDLEAKTAQLKERRAKTDEERAKIPPGEFDHLTGVDASGRDVFSAVVFGTRTTLIIAVTSIFFATLFGGSLGLLAGYLGGRADSIITGLFDVMVAFPPLILALLIVNTYAAIPADPKLAEEATSRRVPGIIIALIVVATPILGRITRASTLTWAGREFVTAARALGAKPLRIMIRDVLPNVGPALMSIAVLGVSVVIVTESGLALVGLGVPAGETVSWGSVIASGANDFRAYPHLVFVPGVLIVITNCAINFLGDALRRKFDVRESVL